MTAYNKSERYERLYEQWHGLAAGETELLPLLANTVALIHHALRPHWTGFYLVKGSHLSLGPFQGPVACSRINYGKGVCGQAWANRKTLVVPDVHHWPGHIACSPLSCSEIVVPVMAPGGEVKAVLDIDSVDYAAFDETDAFWLEKCMQTLGGQWTGLL